MKLLFASDLHGSAKATELVIAHFETEQADWLILLGDILYHGPRNPLPAEYSPAKVIELLNPYAKKIIAVQGNCDSEVDQMVLAFPLLTHWQQLLLPNQRRIFLTHGHHYSPEKLPPLNDGDIFAFGHVHLPQASFKEGIYLFNPGSASLPKDGYPASFGVITPEELSVFALEEPRQCLATIPLL